jgi:hypothetical protein
MRPELLAKIESLVEQGGVIFGQAPEKSPSLQNFPESDKQVQEIAQRLWGAEKEASTNIKKIGKGYVIDELDLQTALEKLGVNKDVIIDENQNVLWTHRNLLGMEIYFLTNQSDEEINFTPSFRVSGMKPQLWDAVTGEIRPLNEYSAENGRTAVPIKMLANQSWFIVFTNQNEKMGKGFEKNFPEFKQLQVIDGQWTVEFLNKAIGPVETVNFESLKDWSQMEDEKIKYYSGTAIYQTTFELNELPENDELFINLGDLSVMAKVKINGADIGGTWMAPFRLKVGANLKKGTNNLEIEVVNLWRNQLIKDKYLPVEKRYTWHLVDDIKEGEELQSSGLLGPVSIQKIVK